MSCHWFAIERADPSRNMYFNTALVDQQTGKKNKMDRCYGSLDWTKPGDVDRFHIWRLRK